MLSDPSKPEEFRTSEHWNTPLLNFQLRVEQHTPGGPAYRSNSLSGNERNRFLIASPDGYHDMSLVSGVDCPEDARSFAFFDYDQDGWLDIALASPNAPRLRIFKNNLEQLGAKGRLIQLKLIGSESNRDACGTLVTIKTNQRTRIFQKAIGEGLSSQNSSYLNITLATGETIEAATVKWPSGKADPFSIDGDQRIFTLSE